MARVYAAEDTMVGRTVAVKALLPEYSRSPGVVERFMNEAKAMGRIRHPRRGRRLRGHGRADRRAVHHHGAGHRPDPARGAVEARAAATAGGAGGDDPARRHRRGRPRPAHHPPRPQARERLLGPRPARSVAAAGADPRLRDRQGRRRLRAHRDRDPDGDRDLYGAGAVPRRQVGRSPHRRLRAGLRVLRAARRPPAVRRPQPVRADAGPPDPGAAPRRAAAGHAAPRPRPARPDAREGSRAPPQLPGRRRRDPADRNAHHRVARTADERPGKRPPPAVSAGPPSSPWSR
jgi:hypothetical protein